MTYYKVVRRHNKKLYSSFIGTSPARYRYGSFKAVRYITNKWTHPKVKGTKLFVTDSFSHAQCILNFDIYCRGHEGTIYECEVENPIRDENYTATFLVDAVKLGKKRACNHG